MRQSSYVSFFVYFVYVSFFVFTFFYANESLKSVIDIYNLYMRQFFVANKFIKGFFFVKKNKKSYTYIFILKSPKLSLFNFILSILCMTVCFSG